jgi:hypothetical protein
LKWFAHQVEELARQILAAPVKLLDRRKIDLEDRREHRVGDFAIGQCANLEGLPRPGCRLKRAPEQKPAKGVAKVVCQADGEPVGPAPFKPVEPSGH